MQVSAPHINTYIQHDKRNGWHISGRWPRSSQDWAVSYPTAFIWISHRDRDTDMDLSKEKLSQFPQDDSKCAYKSTWLLHAQVNNLHSSQTHTTTEGNVHGLDRIPFFPKTWAWTPRSSVIKVFIQNSLEPGRPRCYTNLLNINPPVRNIDCQLATCFASKTKSLFVC